MADVNALAGLVAMAIAATEAEYQTRAQALSVATELDARRTAIAAWREGGYDTFRLPQYGAQIDMVDDGVVWRSASKVVSASIAYLVSLGFTLALERVRVLERPRTVIDLCAELYGDISTARIDFMIATNALTGSEILELPRGKKVVWYG